MNQELDIDYILHDLIILIEHCLNPMFKQVLTKVYGEKSDYLRDWPWNIKDLFEILADHEFILKIKWDKLTNSKSQLRNMGKDLERCRRNQKCLVTIGDLKVFIKDLEVLFQDLPSDTQIESLKNLKTLKDLLESI
jgi:hypothetical protein